MTDCDHNRTRGNRLSLRSQTRWPRFVGHACVHVTGVAAVAGLLAWMAIGREHIRWMISLHQSWGQLSHFASELLIHLSLSVICWIVLYIVGSEAFGDQRRGRRMLEKARGTVITETIIVMPVLLFLVLGICQLAVNNLAGMLLNYGSSQAARTVWVWGPETDPRDGADGPRMGVVEDRVQEMARLQVAAAMTPVAPAVFSAGRQVDSDQFEQMRAMLLASQMSNPPNDSGRLGFDGAEELDEFEVADSLTFVNALDGGQFTGRTVRKFTSAYRAVELEVIRRADEIGVEMIYYHQITFPLMGPVFGQSMEVEGTSGYYTAMERGAFFFAQVPPNAELPRR